ncbi:MAG: rubredoxin [Candidatus Aminicenantes bacterium]|nr:MAG: rubredoxin [Candidatus Aminicenantes bacterium]
MAKYECSVCGFIYDEEKQGKKWEDLPDDWVCPGCGAPKSSFNRQEETELAGEEKTRKKQMICSVCGYIINEGYQGEVCPACGAAKAAFQPYVDKMSPKRRKILNLHIHNILVHFPQAFSFLMLFLIFMTLFLKDSLKYEFMTTFKILSIFLPLSVGVSIISGVIDGKNRFKRITTPILKKKIVVAILFLIFSIGVMLALTVLNINPTWLLRLLIVLTGFCALCSLFLGYNGGRLSGKEVPG